VKGLRRIEVAGAVFPVNDFYRIEATRVAVTVRTDSALLQNLNTIELAVTKIYSTPRRRT
jgi:hypothetical protein